VSVYSQPARSLASCDLVIVGAGPAGMFAARKCLEEAPGLRVVMLDKGKPVSTRCSPRHCRDGREEAVNRVSGAGGAGLFSDGKLVLTLRAGGKLDGVFAQEERANQYLRYVERVLTAYDGYSVRKDKPASQWQVYADAMAQRGITYKHLPVRHMGSENLRAVVGRFFHDLLRRKLETGFEHEVTSIKREKDCFRVRFSDGTGRRNSLLARNVLLAPGKEGSRASWFTSFLAWHGIKSQPNRTYIGVRVETKPSELMTEYSLDPKFYWHYDDGSKMKTHCYCRHGHVSSLRYYRLPLAGGHSPYTEANEEKPDTLHANFSILLGDTPNARYAWKDSVGIMRRVRMHSGGGLLVQRYGDFLRGRATTPERLSKNSIKPTDSTATPGNIAQLGLPNGFNAKLVDFVGRLSNVDPALVSDDTLLYAPAIEWWMPRVDADENLQTRVDGAYVAGDGAGFSQGIVYAAATGIRAAESILRSLP